MTGFVGRSMRHSKLVTTTRSPLASQRVVLLRGINVGGHKKVPMADLRKLAESLGLDAPQTYIASGNLLATSGQPAAEIAARLEEALTDHFGFAVDVVTRTGDEWLTLERRCPFPGAARTRPKFMNVGFCQQEVAPGADDVLSPKLAESERVRADRDLLWLDYGDGVARSKLTPTALDAAAGAPVTCRNWNTVLRLTEMLGARLAS